MRHVNRFLSAHVKLRKRHLLEWDMLAINQQQVLTLVRAETALKTPYTDDKRISADLRSQQASRLMRIMIRQREEREQMRRRHQEEEALFAQVVGTPD